MAFSSEYKTLRVLLDQRGVMLVVINRPEVRNAFNEVMIDELARAFTEDAMRPEVKAVVLRGEGPVFAAGGDLNWMKRSIALPYDQNLSETRTLTMMFAKMNECTKPVIGAIHGAAIGGGVGLVSVCDIAVATAETQFSLAEVRLGIVPACIGPFVVAKIGASHARQLFVSAERFSAAKAKEIGLVHEVAADQRALDQAVGRYLDNLLQCGPNAVATAKRMILDLTWPERRSQLSERNGDPYQYCSKLLADLRVTPEGQEGFRAFLEKRKPSWG